MMVSAGGGHAHEQILGLQKAGYRVVYLRNCLNFINEETCLIFILRLPTGNEQRLIEGKGGDSLNSGC